VPALCQVAAHRGEQIPRGLVLDTLGDDLRTEVSAEIDDRTHDRDVLTLTAPIP
jgi:hypothetical protein